MIKAIDLRIGNYFMFKGIKKPIQIQITDFSSLHDLTPIRLTADWLDKFGFEYTQGMGYNWYQKSFEFSDTKGCLDFGLVTVNENCTNLFVRGDWIKKISCVHELQNLFYCITNEDLIKNDKHS